MSNKYLLCLAIMARRKSEIDLRSMGLDDLFQTNKEVRELEILIDDYPLNRRRLISSLDKYLLDHKMTDREFGKKFSIHTGVLLRYRQGTKPVIKAPTYRRFFVHLFGEMVVNKE